MSFDSTRQLSLPGVICTTLLLLTVGCTKQTEKQQNWPLGDDAGDASSLHEDTETGSDTSNDATSSDAGCGTPPNWFCVEGCGSDAFISPKCVGGSWKCEKGQVRASSCTGDTCPGPTPANCVTSCDQKRGKLPSCPNGGGPQCPDGTFWRHNRCPDKSCKVERKSSNIDGVTIYFTGECEWSVDEARRGITLPYKVVVEKPVKWVVPEPTDAGNCRNPGKSGLIVGERVHGGGQNWCRCDVGLCQRPNYKPRTLRPGTYEGSIKWAGRNWNGPSDTGNPKGKPFPPGTYEYTVKTTGERQYPDARTEKFNLEASLEIRLIK